MPDEQDRNNPTADTYGNKPKVFSLRTARNADHQNAADEHGQSNNDPEYVYEGKIKRRWEQFKKAGMDRHFELVLTLAIVIFAGCQLLITYLNSRSSTQQLRQIIASAQSLSVSADRVDDAAESFSKSSADISRSMGNAVNKLNIQADQTTLLAKSSANSADTAASNLEEFKRTERASVFVRNVEVDPGDGDTSSFNFFLNLSNSGSSSTKHLTINMMSGSHESWGNPINFTKAMKFKASIPAVLGPRSDVRLFTVQTVRNYALSGPFLIFGKITYGDIFGTEHVTEYCWEVVGLPSRDHPSLQPCTWPGDASHNCQDEDCKAD